AFDTVGVEFETAAKRDEVLRRAIAHGFNLRAHDSATILVSFDETVTSEDLAELIFVFTAKKSDPIPLEVAGREMKYGFRDILLRTSPFLTAKVFNSYHTEHEMLRYMKRLEAKDLSLTTSMIPLGSCTMKLNATAEMVPVSWPEFSEIHPFAPLGQAQGYQLLFRELEQWLAEITGFAAVSLQPNAGSQGEYAGLLVIGKYH